MSRTVAAVLIGLLLSTQACNPSGRSSDFERPSRATIPNGQPNLVGPDEPLTIAEARAQKPGSAFLVCGSVVLIGRAAEMCDALAESFPPQCPDGLQLEGLDDSDLPGSAHEAQGVAWATGVLLQVRRTENGLIRRHIRTSSS